MSRGLISQVRRTIRKHGMLQPGDSCLVAVSGGPDSMVLAHILWRLREELEVRLDLAHFNHGLRPRAANDEEVVVRLAKTLALPLSLGKAGGLKVKGKSVEEVARQARYSFLERTREEVGATKIALGHTADDQVETILLNLFRGTGRQGMMGMVPVREGVFIRPLLESWRKDVSEYCRSEGLKPAFDETNLDVRFTRNWMRLRLVPLLEERLGGWKKAVLRCGRLVAQESEALAQWVGDAERQCVLAAEEASISLSTARLGRLPPALRGAVLLHCLGRVAGSGKDLGEAAVRAVWALADSRAGYGIREIRKGLWAEKEYDRLRLSRSDQAPEALRPPSWKQVTLHVPGEASVPEIGLTVLASEAEPEIVQGVESVASGQSLDRLGMVSKVEPWPVAGEQGRRSGVQVFDLERLGRSLVVRAWEPGDRFSPPGLQGHKKLQDFFVDKKVSRPKRGTIPIVADSKGRIAWIVGYAIDERVTVRPDTKEVAVLRAVWSVQENRE